MTAARLTATVESSRRSTPRAWTYLRRNPSFWIGVLYFDRPAASDLVPLDEATAAEVHSILERPVAVPGGRFQAVFQPMSGPRDEGDAPRPGVGEPRDLPSNWNQRWHRALDDWMAVENLEERSTAPGWIDPRVLAILRERAGG